MWSGDAGCAVETEKAAVVRPCQEKGSGRATWLNTGSGSRRKTSAGTSEEEQEEDCGGRYETGGIFRD